MHARGVLAVSFDAQSGVLRSQRLPGETASVVAFLERLPGPTRAAYQAGPTGYGLARALHASGIGLRAQRLSGGAPATLLDHLGAIDTLELRRTSLESTLLRKS